MKFFIFALFFCIFSYNSSSLGADSYYFGWISGSKVNLRKGPGKMYQCGMTIMNPGMPVKVIGKQEGWVLIETPGGTRGWVSSSFIGKGKKRMGVVYGESAKLCRMPVVRRSGCQVIAILGDNVVFKLLECGKTWCRVGVKAGLTGWLKKDDIWGVKRVEEF